MRIFQLSNQVRSCLFSQKHKSFRLYSSKNFPTHSVLTMPALSPTMTQGALGTWHKKIGDEIVPGDVLVEIETDKAQMDFECQEEGFLAKIFIEGGTKDVPVNKPIGILCESKDDVAAFESFTLDNLSPAEGSKESESSKKNEGQKKEQPSPKEKETLSKDSVTKEDSEGDNVEVGKKGSVRIFASPAAKALAAEKGYEISAIKGTGPDGRIVKADVESYKPSSTPQKAKEAPTAKAPSAKAPAGVSYQDVPISNLRRVIAQRLSESKSTIPHYYLTVEVSMDKILKLRQVLNEQANGKYKLSVNDFIVKASGLALKDVPEVNSSWQDTYIRKYNSADIAVAVATENGLITPIVNGVEGKGLSFISNSVKEMAARAKENKLAPHEYQGGTFTISNLGMFNITSFSAIVNPPHSGILAVGTVQDKLVLDESSEKGFAVSKVCSFTCSFDHRTVDGAVGARFMGRFTSYLEDPITM